MDDLANKKCVPCEGGIPAFDKSEIHKYLKKIDGWDVKEDEKNNSPVKTLSVYQSRKPIYNSSKNVSDKFLKFLPFLKELDI